MTKGLGLLEAGRELRKNIEAIHTAVRQSGETL